MSFCFTTLRDMHPGGARYRHTDKSSNFQRYDYDRNEMSATLDFTW
ncbi:MAG: hypothetical protein U5O39_16330 [Gammaproteobacteria bacterium]|nr:hypothetical protein [Gammaproteobacteria bacterium]